LSLYKPLAMMRGMIHHSPAATSFFYSSTKLSQ
jgi:hypothetical protein